jgi:hypothetical protein
MKKIRLVFLAAFLLFLDVATMPNVCAKPEYYVRYDINILNVVQTETEFYSSHAKLIYSIEKNYTLNEDDIDKIINNYFSECYWVSVGDEKTISKKCILKRFDVASVLDKDNNKITFPKEIIPSNFSKKQDKLYWYEITINVHVDIYF